MIRISGAGCSLADFVYNNVDFTSDDFRKYLSRHAGDGGLVPGNLVFLREFENFAGEDSRSIFKALLKGKEADTFNVGGPAIVALITVAQMLAQRGISVSYHGVMGNDWIGEKIRALVQQLPLKTDHYRTIEGTSPFTYVLSDPRYDEGQGERIFINNIGVSETIGPEDLPAEFFNSDIALFGATALTPRLHGHLTELVRRAKEHGAITVVTTVYDFRSEKENPEGRWPLGDTEETFKYTDLFLADRVEALRISGKSKLNEACDYYMSMGVSFAITHGTKPVRFYSNGRLFRASDLMHLPISESVGRILAAQDLIGDTTGCGDNFVGGVLASMAMQLDEERQRGEIDLAQAVATGICAGGSACFHLGGVRIEEKENEKLQIVRDLYQQYRRQIQSEINLPEFAE